MAQGQTDAAGYGLRRDALSPMETLAQSVSTIAPTTTPVATIPLVCALAGNGTWLAYVLATVAILLVAWCIGRFALHLRGNDPAAMAWRHHRLEPAPRLRRHGVERDGRFLSVRQPATPGRDRPRDIHRSARADRCRDRHV